MFWAEVVSLRQGFECRLQRLDRLRLRLNLVGSIRLFDKHLFIHSSLDYQERCSDEALFEQLSLEHLDKVLNPELLCLLRICCRFLLVIFLRRIRALLLGLMRLRLQKSNFRRLFQCKLAVLAIDALGIKRLAASFDLNLSFD